MSDDATDTLTVADLMVVLKVLCDQLNNNQGIQYRIVFGNGVMLFVDGRFVTSGLRRVAETLLIEETTDE